MNLIDQKKQMTCSIHIRNSSNTQNITGRQFWLGTGFSWFVIVVHQTFSNKISIILDMFQ